MGAHTIRPAALLQTQPPGHGGSDAPSGPQRREQTGLLSAPPTHWPPRHSPAWEHVSPSGKPEHTPPSQVCWPGQGSVVEQGSAQ